MLAEALPGEPGDGGSWPVDVVAHPDPVRLERELLARVDAAHPRGPGRTLVVVPTTRLATHVQRRLAAVRPAWIGLEVVQFRSLAYRILDRAGVTYKIASPRLLEALLREILDKRKDDDPWTDFVRSRPGSLRRLREALNDLRESGLAPRAVDAVCRKAGDRGRSLGRLYGAYHRALEKRAESGWTDDAGLIRAATEGVPAFAEGLERVFVHGAYELIGVQLDLVRALGQTVPVTALVPVRRGAPVSRFAESFATDFLLDGGGELETLDDGDRPDRATRLASMYDEERLPPAADAEAFSFRHTQGPAAEVEAAVREALDAVGNGVPPTEIAITARSLEPFAAAIEESLASHEIPFTSSLDGPLRRHPAVRDFLLLLEVLDENFPRRATAELLRSPRVRWSAILREPHPPRGDLADVWSRKARIVGGLEEWTTHLEAWAERPTVYRGQAEEDRASATKLAARRAGEARRIGRALDLLRNRVRISRLGWSRHADALGRLLEYALEPPVDAASTAAVDELRRILEEMRLLETFVGNTRPVTFKEARHWLQEAVDGTRLPFGREDTGGVRILDAMQLRGLTFRHVHFLGMNSGVFPRNGRDDPILTDAMRLELRRKHGRPIPIKSRSVEEERLLLSLVVGAATERVDLSWQRADESGRAKTPTLALREVARVAFGRPDLDAVHRCARHLPSHPSQWLEELVASPGLLTPGDEQVLAALHSRGESASEELAQRFPSIADGLRLLRATQAFHFIDAEYDARVGPIASSGRLSVSALETLGRCPLQFFFDRVLRVGELDREASAFEVAAQDLGNEIHEILERIYTRLDEEGLFEAGSVERLEARAVELLEEDRAHVLGPSGERLLHRLPVLWELKREQWMQALRAFLEIDLDRLVSRNLRPVALEEFRSVAVDFGESVVQEVAGRFDRILEGPEGKLVGDYKTSGKLDIRVNPTYMLKGQRLQVALYQRLAGEGTHVELLGVGPTFDPERARHTFEGFAKLEQAQSFDATMRTLLGLRDAGTFPMLPDPQYCSWCRYEQACRRNHPPTRDREDHDRDTLAIRGLRTKSARKPQGAQRT